MDDEQRYLRAQGENLTKFGKGSGRVLKLCLRGSLTAERRKSLEKGERFSLRRARLSWQEGPGFPHRGKLSSEGE